MKTYVCSVCGYVYEEEKGIPSAGIAPGTRWEELPADWVCPLCGAGKSAFKEKGAAAPAPAPDTAAPQPERELSAMEVSILCSNLARGCEKQYLAEQAAAFAKLAEHFRAKAGQAPAADFAALAALVEQDLAAGYPHANAVAGAEKDRGALRALVWSEKVTNMLDALLKRYAREGEKMLENTGVYVCTICGFIYVGPEPPALCPVCKVPAWKFEKVERRAM
ncbi:MAG TPA: rubredoxin [Candidatus Fournierella merdigallinarum]|nr:rubredoxin [Candidatus Fournierella merdigallinarum]